jgi:hypothetical protein
MRKRYIYGVAAAALALAWGWHASPPGDAPAPDAEATRPTSVPPAEAALQLPQRALPSAGRNPFDVPRKPKPAPVVVAAPVIEAPKAPPLPYKYDGSGAVQGKTFVFLARNGKSVRASVGDTLDGTYLVEAVGRDRVALRYLPLGIRQVLMYAGGEETPEVAEADSGRPLALQVEMPGEVVVGQEFVVSLAIPGAGGLKATVEVRYDTEVLRALGATVRRPGRALVEVAGGSAPRAQLRFRVLADSPAATDIDLQVNATDERGRRVPVSSPSAQTVSLVLPGA